MGLIVQRATFQVLRDSLAEGRIVFTNGCFDILHVGHITLLNYARSLGDALVVGLNSDASVRRLKGDQRPVLPEEDRARMLASLPFVTFVIIFDEELPIDTIKAVRPHVYVKGGTWKREDLPEVEVIEAIGGEVVMGPNLEGHSTTSIIERLTPQNSQTIP
jgi:rfaE bifunctional protein nucleotidyltransferase chain/domain